MNKVEIRIDKRTEIMSILLYISNYRKEFPDLIKYDRDIQYVNNVYETFSKFSNHKAVALLNEIIENLSFSYDAPYVLATQLNEDFSVGKLLENPYKSRLKSAPVVLEFLNEIKNFAEKSGFEKFYKEHEDLYQKSINKMKETVDFDQLSKFEEFFKVDTNRRYIVNFLPLEARGGSYYDWRADFIVHLRRGLESEFAFIGKGGITNNIFRTFTLCLLRDLVEKNNFKVPETKEFSDILKSKHTAINNIQYICNEIADVLRIVFQKNFLNVDDEVVKEKLSAFKTEDKQRVYKTYEILQKWQKSNKPLENYLQQIFDLF